MEVKIKHNTGKGCFKAEADGEKAGLMTYQNAAPDIMVIDHTEVEPRLENRGIGTKMVVAAVEYARENDKKIIPQCAFARAIFARKKEMQDVLYKM